MEINVPQQRRSQSILAGHPGFPTWLNSCAPTVLRWGDAVRSIWISKWRAQSCGCVS